MGTDARLKNDPKWTGHAVCCGHCIMLDRPEDLNSLRLAEAPN